MNILYHPDTCQDLNVLNVSIYHPSTSIFPSDKLYDIYIYPIADIPMNTTV